MRKIVPPLVIAFAALVAWQLLSIASGPHAVSAPLDTVQKLLQMMTTARFWLDVAETGTAFLWALTLSILGGFALGVILGLSRAGGDIVEPILVNFYAMPKVTLYPLVLLAFGLGMSAKVAFGVMHGLVPITLMTRNAISQLKPVYWRTALTLKLSPAAAIRHVILPAVVPELVAGIRIGFSLSLLGVLIGEMFASKRGLGFAAINAMGLGDVTTIMAIGIFLALVAIAATVGLLSLENLVRRATPGR
jgi:NitT/TauT family transport system permease protein